MPTEGERAYQALREAILHGEFTPGEKLNEVALGDQFEVSRTPIREALRKLANDGLVEVEANRGARVVQWTQSDLNEIFTLRALLEGHGAALAATRRSAEHLHNLEHIAAAMDELGEHHDESTIAARTSLNNDFHRAILHAAASPRLLAALNHLVNVPLILRTFANYSAAALARSQQQHRDLVTAIRAQSPEWARATMSAHILAGYEEIASSSRPVSQ